MAIVDATGTKEFFKLFSLLLWCPSVMMTSRESSYIYIYIYMVLEIDFEGLLQYKGRKDIEYVVHSPVFFLNF